MYYTAKVEMKDEAENGNVKKKTEQYLVKAESVTDAESIITKEFQQFSFEWRVVSVTESKIVDVLSAGPEVKK